jgi:subtilase family serine protease
MLRLGISVHRYLCLSSRSQELILIVGFALTMKKILAITTLAIAALMLTPMGIGPVTSLFNFNYSPTLQYLQLGPLTTLPQGIPLCKSASLGNIVCYTPSFIKKAYNYPSTATLDGSGQTIVIVDAFGSPTITSDLALFDARFGIPAPTSFTIFCGDSPTPFDTSTCPIVNISGNPKHGEEGWGIETSLDVEYAHAMAPGAKIVLDVADTSSGNALNNAETAAIAAFPGAVFSQSFGIPEIFLTHNGNPGQVSQAQKNYATGIAQGDTFLASAGDTGADFGFGVAMANFPGSDIHNTGVTGTQGLPYNATGTLQPCGAAQLCTSGLSTYMGPCVLGRTTPPNCTPVGYGGEQVWNEPSFGAATGGAPSLLFGVPSYQGGLGLTARGPDVAYNAAINGGVLVVYGGLGVPLVFIVGGTSAGSPQWAGIIALANQARANLGKATVGDLNPVLYGIYNSARRSTDFHDITVGNDQLVGSPVGFSAGTGYDLASGIGSPIVDQLIVDLAAA